MEGYKINGIQQVGVGTLDFGKSKDWFIKHFGFDVKILEDDTVAERMLPYTGGKAQKRHAGIMVNLNGGGGLEIWQYSERKPLSRSEQVKIADTGIFAAKIRCRDISEARKSLQDIKKTPTGRTPDGLPCFWAEDLYGNIFQVVEDEYVFIPQKTSIGGVCGALVGVTDMDRSVKFYRDVLGYDKTEYDVSGAFEDWAAAPGGERKVRRVLLSSSQKPRSAFSPLFGDNKIELVQPLEIKPEKIYEGRFWGDPGFIQICYDVTGMDSLKQFCESKGAPFTVDSCPGGEIFDMGDASGRFTYIEDPDGTLIEFVETYKVPLAKKLGLNIDMSRRDPSKPLPSVLFKIMGIVSRQK